MSQAALTVAGPVDRESFEHAQRRHRRASWRFTALCAAAIGVMGVSLSAILSPLVYAAAFVANDLVNFLWRTPDLLRGSTESGQTSATSSASPALIAGAVVLLILPGALALLFSWIGVRALFRRAGAGAAVLALGARDPRVGELEEQQVVNVVAEMAAAAGVPPPAVKLLDSPVANAAAVGSTMDDATIVVTTGLLRELDRDETQGVVGHLVGSVGNGDLRIAVTISSVFETLGMVSTMLRAPTEKKARVTLRRLLRFAFARHRDPADTATVANLLAQAGEDWDPDNSADNSARDGTSTNTSTKKPNSFWAIVTLPVLMAGGAFMMNDLVFTMLLVNPLLRRAWRARRYLADATAVQLTRNPQGLARALSKLGASAAVVPGAEWAGHVFVVGDPRHEAKGSPLVDFNPRLDRRVERLDRLGADVPLPPPRRKLTGKQRLVVGVLATLVSPLLIAAVLAMFAAALMLTSISLFIDMMFLFAPLAVVHHFMRQAAR